ncbi:extracellular solute-binding protein [Polynucleobacter rarus]|uniref:extracellular solute-binding protein n=1 Tax=Polynucleobacter rarus TaxID=556055 RepID=UPI000D3E7E74|nr:extracellular solute-binding protein [Polynucleobacter rarus]
MSKRILLTLLLTISLVSCGKKEQASTAGSPNEVPSEEKVLNVYNWPDYIAKDMLANFEKETGIKVNYQNFETNEALQAKLIAGNTGFDIVVPGAVFAKSQIEENLFQKLDKSKIPNYSNVDKNLMSKLEKVDPGNQYLLPWAWSYTTVGFNKAKVKKALGDTPMPDNAWDLVFNPTYTNKLKTCGIAFLDSPTEVIPPALHYLGKDPYSPNVVDHKEAGQMLAKVRKDIRIFTSTMIDDLAGGKACVVLGWAGDINIARSRALENKNGVEIEALLPINGGLIFFDNLAIPKDAKHPQNALAFMNYFLKPQVSADQTNELSYPTVNKASISLVNPDVASNKTIYLEPAVLAKMVPPTSISNAARSSMTEVYTAFKKGS